MDTLGNEQIEAAEVVFPCESLAENLAFFTETLGFRLQIVYPADAPRVAVVSGYGVRIRLEEKPGKALVLLHLGWQQNLWHLMAHGWNSKPQIPLLSYQICDLP
jgi:catechol 2,3-dioxygenase-like lactoylglutathione lyase family enzyme